MLTARLQWVDRICRLSGAPDDSAAALFTELVPA